MSSADLLDSELAVRNTGESKYDAAQRLLQIRGFELSLDQKLRVLDHLAGFEVKLELSGGDALITTDGMQLLAAASARFGRNRLSLTVTGAGVKRHLISRIASLIGEFNFTFDSAEPEDAVIRSRSYAASNLRLAKFMHAAGVGTRAEFPLTRSGARPEHLARLYLKLAAAGVDKLLLMRQFPVGRGMLLPEHLPTRDEYLSAIAALRELEKKYQRPELRLQCALRHIELATRKLTRGDTNPCDLGRVSYGLMSDGTLLASPWAVSPSGRPLHPSWILGNLAKSPLSEILAGSRSQAFIRRSDENFGECKVFSFLHSHRTEVAERFFDRADPLYHPAL
jgi:MoaA/NifB/PqqE/SkfB family radical SAM enzyme